MKLTPAILRQCYELLRETPPFDRWRLPSGDQVQFVVMPGSKQFGDFTRLKHRQRIRVWAGMHARLSRVIETVAHEMCHMKQRSHAATKNSATHGPAFQKLANQVCRHHPDFERPVF